VNEGERCLNEALIPSISGSGNIKISPSDDTISPAFYYLAVFKNQENSGSLDEIEKLIEKGYSRCPPNSKFHEKFIKFDAELHKGQRNVSKPELRFGIIKYFDNNRKFGVVESNGESFIFFPNSFATFTKSEDIKGYRGQSVSFIYVVQQNKPVAKQIKLLE